MSRSATPADDTASLVGGPIKRYGGKGCNAPALLPHFARAKVYAEPFFGAGGIFYRIPPGTYEREAVNDLDASLMAFFRALRDNPAELIRRCEATPHARDEFIACLARSDDPMEEARRVWVRHRQGFAGRATCAGNWGRDVGDYARGWLPGCTESKLAALPTYAARLRRVAIDNVDAVEFVDKWGQSGTFLYCDPPYVADTRKGGADYEHEMDEADHRRLAAALHAAVERGARVALSGYPSALYDELFARWRRVTTDVALGGTRNQSGHRRTEVLWMSYPEHEALGYTRQLSLLGGDP